MVAVGDLLWGAAMRADAHVAEFLGKRETQLIDTRIDSVDVCLLELTLSNVDAENSCLCTSRLRQRAAARGTGYA